MSRIISITAALVMLACTGQVGTPSAPSSSEEMAAESLVDGLRRAGLAAEDAGMLEQPFFSVPAHVYIVDGGDLQIYTFATTEDAAQAAAKVSPNGMTIGTSSMSWMAPPHFFRKDRLIVNYLGSSPAVLAELDRLLGSQFAGQ